MDRAQWRDRAALSALLLIAMSSTAVTPAALSAGLRPPAAASVDCRTVPPAAAARGALASQNTRSASVRVQAQVARRGELTGRVLTAQGSAGAPHSIALPVESFVGPTVGDLIVYTRHSAATGSEVRALNLANGCDIRLATPTEIVRSAVMDATATSVYVHSVKRGSRADAGVVRYDLVTGRPDTLLPPLSAPEGFGPIFGTDLRWDVGDDTLAVQSCGFRRCLTRLVDIGTGEVTTFDQLGQGAFIALTSEHLLTFADCPGMPCAVLSTNLASGSVSVVAEDAYSAAVGTTGAAGTILVINTAAGQMELVQ